MMGQASILNKLGWQSKHAAIDWNQVYAEQLPRVYNFFRYRTADEATAEDLTATTFEKAWKARSKYREDIAGFSTWLFGIARNVANDYFRSKTQSLKNAVLSLEVVGDLHDENALETQLQHTTNLKQLARLLSELDDRERELLSLKFGAGLTNRHIATLVHLSESNVGTILNRVVTRLRDQMIH